MSKIGVIQVTDKESEQLSDWIEKIWKLCLRDACGKGSTAAGFQIRSNAWAFLQKKAILVSMRQGANNDVRNLSAIVTRQTISQIFRGPCNDGFL